MQMRVQFMAGFNREIKNANRILHKSPVISINTALESQL